MSKYMVVAIVLLVALAFLGLSCGNPGNATEAERGALLQAVRNYWDNVRDYSLGFTSGVGELNYADVQGSDAEVRVDIIVGYTQPTDGAGYKDTSFRLHKTDGSWKVTYDGWADKNV